MTRAEAAPDPRLAEFIERFAELLADDYLRTRPGATQPAPSWKQDDDARKPVTSRLEKQWS